MVTQQCEYIKCHWVVHLQNGWNSKFYIIWTTVFYHNKIFLKNRGNILPCFAVKFINIWPQINDCWDTWDKGMKQFSEVLFPQRAIFLKPQSELLWWWHGAGDLFLALKFCWPCHPLPRPGCQMGTVSPVSSVPLKSRKNQTKLTHHFLPVHSPDDFTSTPFSVDFSFLNEEEKHHTQ